MTADHEARIQELEETVSTLRAKLRQEWPLIVERLDCQMRLIQLLQKDRDRFERTRQMVEVELAGQVTNSVVDALLKLKDKQAESK